LRQFAAKRGSVLDAVDVNRCYRTARRWRVRVGRDTGRLRIGGKKAIAGAKSRPSATLSKFFAWPDERTVQRARYALWATTAHEIRAPRLLWRCSSRFAPRGGRHRLTFLHGASPARGATGTLRSLFL